MKVRDQILEQLSQHPEGLSGSELAELLGYGKDKPQTVNGVLLKLEQEEGLVRRRKVPGSGNAVINTLAVAKPQPQIVISPTENSNIWQALQLLEQASDGQPALQILYIALQDYSRKLSLTLLKKGELLLKPEE